MNPLDQLADITVPDQVSAWPLAWGYWVSALLVLLIIISAWHYTRRYLRINKRKKLAITEIQNLMLNGPNAICNMNVILKHTCNHYFSNSSEISVAPLTLHGENWKQFLLDNYQGKETSRLDYSIDIINQCLYQNLTQEQLAQMDFIKIKMAIVEWIQTSLPPRKKHSKLKQRGVDSHV